MAESEPDVKAFSSGKSPSQRLGGPENLSKDIGLLIDYYEVRGKKRTLVIFNHFQYKRTIHFRNHFPRERTGTSQDTKRLREVFQNLGFIVEDHHDLNYDQIMDEMYLFSKQDHSNTGCVAVAVLTHGEVGGCVLAADRPYPLKELWTPLKGDLCPQLAGVPKLFFIQACRGADMDSGVHVDSESASLRLPSTAHFLFMYSTVEDYVSWRDAEGSWFIQALCQVLEKHHDNLELLQILTMVNGIVGSTKTSNTLDFRTTGMKQMPQIVSTLTKQLKL